MTYKSIILLLFVIAKIVLQYLLINPEYQLHRDEYLHLDQAHHLAWGYLSVPPVTSWISYLIYMLGNSVFWVKFFPALFGALTIVVVWKTVEELKGNLLAMVLAATSVLFSALPRLNILYQPNSLDILCWTTLFYLLIKYINTESVKWLFAMAFVFAIGFLNKYTIAFLAIGLIPALIVTPQRTIFGQRNLYIAGLLALLIILPNLIWQYQNDFPVFYHLKTLADTQLVNVNRWDFLIGQLFFFIGSLLLIIVALAALLFYPPFKKYSFLFWALVFILALFTYLKAKDYYAIGLYPVFIAFGSVFLVEKLNTGWKKAVLSVFMISPVLTFAHTLRFLYPNKSPQYIMENQEMYKRYGTLRWEDGKDHHMPQDYADMLGWEELAIKVDSVCAAMPNLEQTIVLCDNYGMAGAINFYSNRNDYQAVSFNADYLNWIDLDVVYVDAVLVKAANDEDPGRTEEIPLFDTVYLATKRIHPFARESEISIYVLKGAKIDINERIHEEMLRKKNFQ